MPGTLGNSSVTTCAWFRPTLTVVLVRVVEPEAYDHRVMGHLAGRLLRLNLVKKARILQQTGAWLGAPLTWCSYKTWTVPRLRREAVDWSRKQVDYLVRYLVRGDKLIARTRDHSYSELQETMSQIVPMGERFNRNVLFTCLGSPGKPVVDTVGPLLLQSGDRLLLCSDGLWGTVSDAEIRAFRDARDWMQFHAPKELAVAIAVTSVLERLQRWRRRSSRSCAQRTRETIRRSPSRTAVSKHKGSAN